MAASIGGKCGGLFARHMPAGQGVPAVGEYLYALKKKDKEARRKEQALLNRQIESDLDDALPETTNCLKGLWRRLNNSKVA